jgi:hypothetical protein
MVDYGNKLGRISSSNNISTSKRNSSSNSKISRPPFRLRVLGKKNRGIGAVAGMIIGVLFVVIIFLALIALGFISIPTQQIITPTQPTVYTQPSAQGVYYGPLNVVVGGQDYFNPSTTYVPGTNFNVIWYDNPTGNFWNNLGTNSQTINVKATDNGIIYALVTLPSGQNYYVAQYRTVTQGAPYVQGWSYTSLSNNGVNNFLFKINLAGPPPITSNGVQNPQISFYPVFVSSASMSLNTLSAINNLGQNPNTQFLSWIGTFPSGTPNVGTKISEVQISVNSSNPAVMTLNSVNIPATNQTERFVGAIPGSRFTAQQGTTNYIYTLPIASNTLDLSTAEFILYPQNGFDNFAFTTSVTTDFGAQTTTTNCLNVQITLYFISPADTLSTLTQSVNLAAGAVC